MGLTASNKKRVSNHAKQRCMERFGVSNKVIKDIMRTGFTIADFEGAFHDYLVSIQSKKGGAVNVKVKGNILVVYNKRSQKAITTWKVPRKYVPIERYLIPSLRDKYLPKKLALYLWQYLNSREVIKGDNGSPKKSK